MSFIKKIIKRKNTISAISSVVTTTSIILGGFYTIFQYDNYQHEKKVNRVLEYSEKFSEQKLSQAWNNVNNDYYHKFAEVETLLSKETFVHDYHEFVIELEKKNNKDLEQLGDFFENLANCVDSNLCDKTVANQLFGRKAKEYYRRFYPRYCQKQKFWRDETIGSILEEVYNADKKNKVKTCDYMKTQTIVRK